MKIEARIDKMINGKKLKAIASVSFDKMYVIKNLRVVDGNKGLFVGMPQEEYTDKQGSPKKSNIFFPTTNLAKCDLEDAVLEAYRLALNQEQGAAPQQANAPTKNYPILDDGWGMLPFDL